MKSNRNSWWERIKRWFSSPWRVLGSIFVAIMLVLAGERATRKSRQIRAREDYIEDLLNSGIKKEIARGQQLRREMEAEKKRAQAASETATRRLEQLGDRDETLKEVADRFNSKRPRTTPDRD